MNCDVVVVGVLVDFVEILELGAFFIVFNIEVGGLVFGIIFLFVLISN